MIKVSWNFGAKVKCCVCQSEDDTQEHLLVCPGLQATTNNNDDDGADEALRMRNVERAVRKREALMEKQT